MAPGGQGCAGTHRRPLGGVVCHAVAAGPAATARRDPCGVLFGDVEWSVTGRWWPITEGRKIAARGRVSSSARKQFSGESYPNGVLLDGVQDDVLDILDATRFECTRLAWSCFAGEWDDQCRPVLADRLAEPHRAVDRAHAALALLKTMAAVSPNRYQRLCDQVEYDERAGRDRQWTRTVSDRRNRLAATRAAVLLRSGPPCQTGVTHGTIES